MSLTTYDETRPWAKAIRDQVLERRMPPWDAVKGVGDFAGDQSLSQPELDLFVAWVEGGAPEGDHSDLPSAPAFKVTPAQALPSSAKTVRVTKTLTIQKETELLSILPEGALEVTACSPGGGVDRLLWVRDFRPEWNRTYMLRRPVPLLRGTKILVYSRTNSAARLLIRSQPEP